MPEANAGARAKRPTTKFYRICSLARGTAALAVGALFTYFFCAPPEAARGELFEALMQGQFSTALVRGGAFFAWVVAAIATTLLLGRVYCSVLCPMGTLQEFFWRFLRAFPTPRKLRIFKGTKFVRPWNVRYLTPMLAGLGIALGVAPFAFALDPISNFGRGVRASAQVFVNGLAGDTSPLFLVPFAFILLFALFRGRRFCDWCPVGVTLGLFAHVAPFGMRFTREECVSCGACERACPMNCVDARARRIDTERCVLCVSCAAACGAGCFRYGAPARSAAANATRRTFLSNALKFIGSGFALFSGGVYLGSRKIGELADRVLPPGRTAFADVPILPPGAGTPRRFAARCVSCQACVAVCPVGIVKTARSTQPRLDYSNGYCQYNCVACGEACPTGAIARLRVEEKRTVRVARTFFNREDCVVITQRQACGACAEVCPTRALRMEPLEGSPALTIPVFDPDYCIGCGACLNACPADPLAFEIEGVEEQTRTPGIRPTQQGDGGLPPLPGTQDFPF